ncbi:60S ribosomal protein L2 [Mucor velutinosus]|uniref:60S ribosomal protein L2 n=1 Tax=Mucor velutinosus TaxID=708070 RepID=A0AAN7DP18_9FUNG|nr:60S ribosomal protein L2 [Mucor velutinosus]
MAQIFDSRKPEPYIKSSCKKCITPIEFYPQGQAVGQRVSVKCWACEQVETYTVTEPIVSTPHADAKSSASKARSSRKKGTDQNPISTEYYEILGVSVTATPEEIKKAYRRRAVILHPDKNPGDPTMEEKFKKLSEANQVLSDPKLRKKYNEYGDIGVKPDGGFVDPEDFFKQSFGGDRFVDIIGEISIGKDMREALDTAEEDEADLTPEEKAEREVQKTANEQERNLVRARRIEYLVEKLTRKLDLYNTQGEQEFKKTIKTEAEDLKGENHGVDLLHTIGYIYSAKANHYGSKKSAFGLGGMYYSIREKGYIFSQTVGTLRTAYDLQSTFGELQKAEEKGLSEEERAKLEEAAAAKGLEAIWRGSKLEIEGVLRDVCDEVLSDAKCTKTDLANRIHALSVIGTIYQAVVSDEPASVSEEQQVPETQ